MPRRQTDAARKILETFIENESRSCMRRLYGQRICTLTGLASGTVHPILRRLEKAGWLESEWNEARRFYRLTAQGAHEAPLALRLPARGNPTV